MKEPLPRWFDDLVERNSSTTCQRDWMGNLMSRDNSSKKVQGGHL